MSDPVSDLEDALEGLRAAASARVDVLATLADDEGTPPSVLNAMDRARERDARAPSLEQGSVGSGRLVKGAVSAALAEVDALRATFERSAAEVVANEDLSAAGQSRRLGELRDDFQSAAKAALDGASEKVQRFAETRLHSLARDLTPSADSAQPDALEALGAKVDSLNLTLASANATDAAFEQFARRLIERGDPRAAALLEAAEAQGRDPLILQRLAAVARATGASQARSAAERFLTADPKRLVDAAELRWVRELHRQAAFVLDALKRNPAERPIVPSSFEIL